MSQRDENSHSHDSAIDAGDWGSTDLKSLQNETIPYKGLKVHSCTLSTPCNEVFLDMGLHVARSAIRKLWPGDRIVSVNSIPIDANNCYNFKNQVNSLASSCNIKFTRQSVSSDPIMENNNVFMQGVLSTFTPNSPDSALDTHKELIDASSQTTGKLFERQRKNRKQVRFYGDIFPP